MISQRETKLQELHRERIARQEAPRTNDHRPGAGVSLEAAIGALQREPGRRALFEGGNLDYPSDSEADGALFHHLAFFCQKDPGLMEEAALRSGRRRPKWDERRNGTTWLRWELKKAAHRVEDVWTPGDGAQLSTNGHKGIHSSAPRDGVADERILRFKTAKELAQETPAITEWIARPWVAKGAITEVDGKIKAGGKTTWITHMARKILDGEPFMGEPTTRTKAIFLTEQPPASFRKALERADLLEREDLLILHWSDTRGVTWPDVARAAVEKAAEVGAAILFVDTLGQFAGIRGDGENNAGAAQEAMKPLQDAAAKGLAVVLTRHERKGGGEVGESGRGSSAFGGAVDVILSIRRGEGNTRPTVRIIESLSRFDETPSKLVIELTEGGYRSLGDATAFAEQEAMKAIVELLPSKEENALSSADILDKLKEQEIKRTVASEALAKLANSGTVRRIGAGKKGNPYRYHKPTPEEEKGSFGTLGVAEE